MLLPRRAMPQEHPIVSSPTRYSDLRLRFWITLAKRIIYVIDGIPVIHKRLKSQPARPIRMMRMYAGVRREVSGYPFPAPIPVRHGQLDARLLVPGYPLAAVLICHGIGDRLSYWEAVQMQLASFGIVSLIFDYASYGESTGSLSVQTLREDTQAAYSHLRAFAPGLPVFVLGFSMGTGVATDAIPHLSPPPAGLILCQPFTSLRAAVREITRSTALSRLLPDVWNTAASLPSLTLPILIVHGDADRLFPLAHAHSLHSVCPEATLAIPPGFTHPAGYLNPTLEYWQPILNFIKQNMH